MSFEEILDHALAMLQRRGRLTYRTLQRQFHLDDDALNDLKDALVYAYPEVHDDAGRGLVWMGVPTATGLDTRQQAEAERQFHTVLLAVMALLQREQRVTYRTLHYVFGVDEACLHAVRDELRFRQMVREEGGQLRTQGAQRGIDHRVAERRALCIEGGDRCLELGHLLRGGLHGGKYTT